MEQTKDAQRARLHFTQSPRTPHLYRIWQQLQSQEHLPQVDRWLSQYFRGEKRFGQRDRQWYGDAIFQALRIGIWALAAERMLKIQDKSWGPEHEEVLISLSPQQVSPAITWQKIFELPVERLYFWLSLRALAPSELNSDKSDESQIIQIWQAQLNKPLINMNAQLLWHGIPLFFAADLELRCSLSSWNSRQLLEFLSLQCQQAPLWIRANPWANVELVAQQLTEAGYVFEIHGEAWLLHMGKGLQNLECFRRGWIEIQDFASQRIGIAVAAKAGQLIWDCCAGGGGKTLQIAAHQGKIGSVFASDVRAYKLSEVQRRAERAGVKNIHSLAWAGTALPILPKIVQKAGGFDSILIDAPCSATGTWRRSPDARYRFDAEVLGRLQNIQKGIFAVVLPALKPGGRIIYATCSWLPVENEDIIHGVLQDFPELDLISMQLTGSPDWNADTMFVAVLQSKKYTN